MRSKSIIVVAVAVWLSFCHFTPVVYASMEVWFSTDNADWIGRVDLDGTVLPSFNVGEGISFLEKNRRM